ncbi:MAG TPA: Rho termination factor N-terminal domain-containing protein [Solirubrobacterales bacterium]|nr:Rho termination factor N-terminal domain-containing protein [Solirubrobacterales bacterium]
MNKAELEKKHLSDLHLLAAEAGVDKYRMLTKSELIDRLAGGDGGGAAAEPSSAAERNGESSESSDRPRRRRRRRRTGSPAVSDEIEEGGEAEPEAQEDKSDEPEERPRPRRRRRRFGRRGKQGVTLQTLLLPPEAGRQALVFAETREGCTTLLRAVAADLAGDDKGPDPVALLIDPSPEELADWKRDAPQAEIVSAGQPRHASDALAQAAKRAGDGEDVILLVDSLTRLGEAYGDAEAAKEFFDAGREQGSSGGGSLTVVAALERPNGD